MATSKPSLFGSIGMSMAFLLGNGLYKREFQIRGLRPLLFCRQVTRPAHGGTDGAGEVNIPMASNTGARGGKRCSDLFGIDRIYLHFNSGWRPMDLQKVHLRTIWTKPAHTPSLRQGRKEPEGRAMM
jgi:hypothetical protein